MVGLWRTVLTFLVVSTFVEAEGSLPWLGWYGPPSQHSTAKTFFQMRSTGIQSLVTEYPNLDRALVALQGAEEAGVTLYIKVPELLLAPQKAVSKLKASASLAGYFLADEPKFGDLASLKKNAQILRDLDPFHPIYVNFLPNYANSKWFGPNGYEAYLKDGLSIPGLTMASVDFYAVRQRGLRKGWYSNLNTLSSLARDAKLPIWTFVQITKHSDYPAVTPESLRLQAWTNLAFGSRALQFFTFWTPGIASFSTGILERSGVPGEAKAIVEDFRSSWEDFSAVVFDNIDAAPFYLGGGSSETLMRWEPQNRLWKVVRGVGLISPFQKEGDSYYLVVNGNLRDDLVLRGPEGVLVRRPTEIAFKPSPVEGVQIAPGGAVLFKDQP